MDVQTSYLWYAKCFVDSVIKKIGDENEDTRSEVQKAITAINKIGTPTINPTILEQAVKDALATTPITVDLTPVTTAIAAIPAPVVDFTPVTTAIAAITAPVVPPPVVPPATLQPILEAIANLRKSVANKTIQTKFGALKDRMDAINTIADADDRTIAESQLLTNLNTLIQDILDHIQTGTPISAKILEKDLTAHPTGITTYYPYSDYDSDQAYYPYERQSRSWFW
jgi:hypothetical protein